MSSSSASAAARGPAGDAFLILDVHGRVVYCTDAAAALFERTPDELRHVRASELIDGLPPEGTSATAEVLHADGRRIGVQVRVDAWEVAGPHFCTVLLGDDADTVAALRRSEAKYRDLARMFAESQRFAHVGSFAIEVETRSVRWSNELFRIFGLDPEVRELTMEEMIARAVPADRDRFAGALDAALSGEARLDLKFAIDAGGRERVVRAAGHTSVVAGQPACLFGSVLDVTAEVDASRELDDAKRMTSLGRVAATMAHEFNNVLAGIGSFAEYLNRRGPDDDTRRVAAHIGKAIRRGKTVTDEILRYTRAKPPVLSVIDVHAWLEAFLPEANALTGGRTVLDDSTQHLRIRGDVAQLNQVLVNLLINARDASPGDAPIMLRVTTTARESVTMLDLAVIDRGTGIPPEVRERLFEPLFTTKRSGTGLGLPVVDQVVRAHRGVVRVRTEMGKGSEFHVLLPLHRGTVVERRTVPPSVLIVDDNEQFAGVIRTMLEHEGMRARAVHRGREVMAAIEAQPPDVLILDVGLPDVRGTDLYPTILDRWPDLPIVFVSGAHAAELEPLLRQRHVAFLAKPFAIEELIAAFRLVIAAA
jgi:two-component system cell cycle sensor histidine kinase/response regulator CckA